MVEGWMGRLAARFGGGWVPPGATPPTVPMGGPPTFQPALPAPGPEGRPSAFLQLVTIVVANYDEAIRFFVDALGFDLVEDTPATTNDGRAKRWVVVRPPGAQTAILLARADGDRQANVIGDQVAGRVGFFLEVENFDAAHERLIAAGVEFVTEPRTETYGRFAVFRDVAGNRWDLIEPRGAAGSS